MTTREAVARELQGALLCANNLAAVGDTDAGDAIQHLVDAVTILLNRVERLTGEDR